MIIKKYLLIFLFILPLQAANTDDEIIKNLDFFQNIELLKDDNPYITSPPLAEKEKTSEDLIGKEKIK